MYAREMQFCLPLLTKSMSNRSYFVIISWAPDNIANPLCISDDARPTRISIEVFIIAREVLFSLERNREEVR